MKRSKKARLVERLNEALGMHLALWQFEGIRTYELEEMGEKIYKLKERAEGHYRAERKRQLELEFDS